MPTISMFFGILIRMFYKDNKQHNIPHIPVKILVSLILSKNRNTLRHGNDYGKQGA